MNTLFKLVRNTKATSWWVLKLMGALFCSFPLLPAPAVAQQPAPGSIAPAGAFLGPLILSHGQRRALEASRSAPGSADVTVQAQTVHAGATNLSLPGELAITGIVVRSGNRSTVWINDQPLYGQGPMTPLRTLAGQAGVLQAGGNELRLKSRPGQIIDVPSGQATDMLPPGAIRIIPPASGSGGSQKKELLP